VLDVVGEHHAAHVDLAAAYYRAKDLQRAEHHFRRGLELGYPLVGIVHNYLACIAWAKGSIEEAQREFVAAGVDPMHPSLISNVRAMREWLKAGGFANGRQLILNANHDFQICEKFDQPVLPGPVGPDFAKWS
jgi:Tfp pilus assembly protein PilF